jgi:hypothetical protein
MHSSWPGLFKRLAINSGLRSHAKTSAYSKPEKFEREALNTRSKLVIGGISPEKAEFAFHVRPPSRKSAYPDTETMDNNPEG